MSGSSFLVAVNALLLKLTSVVTGDSTVTSTCKLGDVTCDYGVRSVRLVK